MCQDVSYKVEIIKKTIKVGILSTIVNEKSHAKYMHCLLHQLMIVTRQLDWQTF